MQTNQSGEKEEEKITPPPRQQRKNQKIKLRKNMENTI